MRNHLFRSWTDDQGQDIAEYAVMLAVILVLVVGTARLVGSNANNAFPSVASSLLSQRKRYHRIFSFISTQMAVHNL